MKATAKSPANIAFIKYWGKKDPKIRVPLNSSISMNLSNIYTVTTVEFSPSFERDEVDIVNGEFSEKEKQRIIEHIDRIRKKAGVQYKVKVLTKNNFPKGTGIASSASGFSALTVAGAKAAGLNLSTKGLSILARLGSGSACRSIPDGFVEWQAGNSHETSLAYSLYSASYWEICDLVVIISKKEKKIASTKGHSMAQESPFLMLRVDAVEKRIKQIKKALKNKDFSLLGGGIEAEALNMHAVMMTSNPPIIYWLPKTLEVMLAVQKWRGEDLEGYFTIDAGPIVHIICQKKDANKFKERLTKISGIKDVIVNEPAEGARLVNQHLF